LAHLTGYQVSPMMRLLILLIPALLCAAEYRAPAGQRPAARRPGAQTILPGGRIVAPLGRQFATGPGAFGLAVSHDGKLLGTANGGPSRFSLTFVDRRQSNWQLQHAVAPVRDRNEPAPEDDWRGVFCGIAFDRRGRLYASEGNSGRVRYVTVPDGRLIHAFELNQGPWRDSFAGDIALDERRRLLYVLDQANFRLAIFDTRTRRLLANARTGRLPFRMTLSPDGQRAYVANIGMFQYAAIPGADPANARATGLPFPAFGFPSPEAERGVRRETAGGMVDVPGLGDPNAPVSNSVFVFDTRVPAAPRLLAAVRTGAPLGPRSQGGSSPSGILATATAVYVANGNQDTISVIDAARLRVSAEIELRIPGLEQFRGVLPMGLARDPKANLLYVAESGINAVGVIDLASNRLLGHLPAAWFPTGVAVHGGELIVASAKGSGTGPNASRTAPLARESWLSPRSGTINILPLPARAELAGYTAQVMENNGFLPQQGEPAPLPAAIRHVVIIVKENRTYDEVFGDIESAANGPLNGAPELARFGRRGWLAQDPGSLRQRQDRKFYNITPNHHALAARWAFSDNFYVDSEVSVDGHHWIVGSYPNAWTETSFWSSSNGQRDFRLSAAPGRLLFAQSNSSVHPEELLEAGALWHHLDKHGISFRNFGEGFELAGVDEGPGLKPTGARFLTNVPMPNPLYKHTSREYPGYNMNIPDQYRATQFIGEIEKLYGKTGAELPRLLFVHLPNDHMARPRPADGYPFEASYVSDNDYALGRIMEYLTRTPWWKQMAVFVTEDDAQGGVDHVDSHRTVLLVASPYAKPNYASRNNVSFPGLLKTAFRLLGLPPLNLYDASATDLADCFHAQPDFQPFDLMPVDPDVFDPAKARDPLDPQPSPRMDDPRVLRELNRQR
jgi:YVTN family beta-propeller protein